MNAASHHIINPAMPGHRWAGYIEFLPKAFPGLPLFWTGNDLGRLRGSSAADKMTGRGCCYTRSLEQPSEVVFQDLCIQKMHGLHALVTAVPSAHIDAKAKKRGVLPEHSIIAAVLLWGLAKISDHSSRQQPCQ